MQKTPTNLIIGNLGSGKTTAILNLLNQKPPQEKWVIVQNEFGNTEISDDILAKNQCDLVKISTIAGGCACCTDGVNLEEILLKIVTKNPPDRLILELGTSAHVTRIMDTLRWKGLGEKIMVQMTVCLVDSDDFSKPEILTQKSFSEQIAIADILITKEIKNNSHENLVKANQYFEQLFPKKLIISSAKLPLEWIDFDPRNISKKEIEKVNFSGQDSVNLCESPKPKKPVFTLKNEANNWLGRWTFHASEVFEMGQISALIFPLVAEQKIQKAEGIIRINTEWFSYNFMNGYPIINIATHRRDSHLKIFSDQALDWEEITNQLISCTISEEEWQINYEAMLKQYLPENAKAPA
jgi:G3E family GTPase